MAGVLLRLRRNGPARNLIPSCQVNGIETSVREGWGEEEGIKGVKYTVTRGDFTLGGELTMQHTDAVLHNCTPQIYRMLLTNVTPINLIFLILKC